MVSQIEIVSLVQRPQILELFQVYLLQVFPSVVSDWHPMVAGAGAAIHAAGIHNNFNTKQSDLLLLSATARAFTASVETTSGIHKLLTHRQIGRE